MLSVTLPLFYFTDYVRLKALKIAHRPISPMEFPWTLSSRSTLSEAERRAARALEPSLPMLL